ncbi:hypothetical protein AB4144_38100, partial [Rhizobiaceae sp. 2RAB30]
FGFRRGWPNLTSRQLVTHAVWRVTNINGVAHNGTPQGYTGGVEGGMAIFDTDSLIGRAPDGTVRYDLTNGQVAYTWFAQTLTISDAHYMLFYNSFEGHAQGMTYTGVGANCYTPVVRALADLWDDITTNGLQPHDAGTALADIGNILTSLGGQNFGMGTQITNEGILAGAKLLAMFAMAVILQRISPTQL